MAFKRSAVRSRLSPPLDTLRFIFYSFSPENEYFLCRNPNDVKAHAKLLKVDVKVDMQLVVPVDIHSLDKTVDNHLLGLKSESIHGVYELFKVHRGIPTIIIAQFGLQCKAVAGGFIGEVIRKGR